jgi:hypothetical protein
MQKLVGYSEETQMRSRKRLYFGNCWELPGLERVEDAIM